MNLAAGTGSLGAHLRDKEQPQAYCQDSEGKFLSSGEPGRGSGVCSVRSEKQRECQMPTDRRPPPVLESQGGQRWRGLVVSS